MSDAERQFPAIRVFGTIGWIVAGLIVGLVLPGEAERNAQPIILSATASLLYGLYSSLFPRTPAGGPHLAFAGLATRTGRNQGRGSQLLDPHHLPMLMMIPFIVLQCLRQLVPRRHRHQEPRPRLRRSDGPRKSVAFFALPFFFGRLGMKGVLFIGMAAWAVRYVIFANGFTDAGAVDWLIYIGLALHGVGFDFVFVAATIWIGKNFAGDRRSRAQSFLALMTWGVGYLIGSNVANLVQTSGGGGKIDWHTFWLLPAGFAAVVAAIFLIVFRDRAEAQEAKAS